MRSDIEVADAGTIGQRHRDGRLEAPLSPTRFEDVGDGAGAQRVALERALDGRGEFLWAVIVEQGEQSHTVGPQRLAAGGQALEKPGGDGHGEPQPVARRRGIVLARGGDQTGDVGLLFDGRVGVIAADVPRDLVGAGEGTRAVGVGLASRVSGCRP